MITAEKLKALTNLGTHSLAQCLHLSGYTGASFKTAKFVGITNGNQFCYKVTFYDGEAVGKVFLTYDHVADMVIADY